MLGAGGIGGKVRKVNIGLLSTRKLDFGLFSSFADTLNSHFIFRDVDPILFLELFGNVVLKNDVHIFAATRSVAVGAFYFEDSVGDFEDGNIEGASTEVIDCDHFSVSFIHAVGQGSGSWLVDNTGHL